MKRFLLFFFISIQVYAQDWSFPRSTPEAEGVSSESINRFLDALAKSKHEFHSLMIVRHGKVVAEGWWSPYRPDLKHTMYSCSKSFTATAIGFAVAEKLISVEDNVIKFFPEDVPSEISPNLSELKIKHLLSMSVGHEKAPLWSENPKVNWVRSFLHTPIKYKPGTKFLYNTPATYMLSAIIQKVTDETLMEYLKPRLFEPLGINDVDWETDPNGINVGGWGMRLRTEDMAKFAQLFLQKGMWNGKQILPQSWIEEASTMKIMQNPDATQAQKDSSDWLQGYCYQMWRSRHNSYRGDGAYGQYMLVLPEHDAVIAITGESDDLQGELNLVWKYLLPAFSKEKLPTDSKTYKALKNRLATLALPVATESKTLNLEQQLHGKAYAVFSADRRFQGFKLYFSKGVCSLTLDTDSVDHQLEFGFGKWEKGETTKYGPYLGAGARNNRKGLPPFKFAGSYRWADEKTLELTLRYIESPHTEKITFRSDSDYVNIDFVDRFNRAGRKFRAIPANERGDSPRLIVRGDDMGFSHSANVALIRSYKNGIQTSIEVIAPSPWFPEVVKMLEENPRTDVGLHFAITSEWDNVKWRPLTDAKSLRDEDGYFYPMLYPNKNYPKQSVIENKWNIADVEKELRAQIELALKYIPRLTHISGHMGSTGFSDEVKEMTKRVAREYKLALVDVNSADQFGIYGAGFNSRGMTTDQRIDGFIQMLDKLEPGKTYVYVEHPGLDNEELRAIHHIGYEDVATHRQDVTAIFTSEKVKEAIVRKGIKLVGYKEVVEKKEAR